MLANMRAKILALLWPPIEDSPIEPQATPTATAPIPTFFGDGGQSAAPSPPLTRIPPHQRNRMVASDERWRVYSSFKLPPDSERARSPRRRAS